MHIAKVLTTLLASASLTGFAWGAAINPNTDIKVVRAPPPPPPPAQPHPALPGPAIDEKIRQYCGGYLAKRDDGAPHLLARATRPPLTNEVEVGSYRQEDILGLWTNKLVTCTGIAIVGTPTSGRNTRFMYHTITVQQNFDMNWNAFANNVREAGLQNPRAVISIMHPTDRLPVRFGEVTAEMTSRMNDVIESIKSHIRDLIGADPQVEYHFGLDAENSQGDAGTMQIDMQNNIFVDGRQV